LESKAGETCLQSSVSLAAEWQVLPVTKRPGSPFPERITVGRATNCDIVLRAPSVSKVHAHIVCEAGGAFHLCDNRPSNATFLNDEKLAPGESRALQLGDLVRFGPLEFEFVDATRLHDIVNREAPTAS
jgi:pSer/pThr/pTyr-binding forkhead associated (FHA) protein